MALCSLPPGTRLRGIAVLLGLVRPGDGDVSLVSWCSAGAVALRCESRRCRSVASFPLIEAFSSILKNPWLYVDDACMIRAVPSDFGSSPEPLHVAGYRPRWCRWPTSAERRLVHDVRGQEQRSRRRALIFQTCCLTAQQVLSAHSHSHGLVNDFMRLLARHRPSQNYSTVAPLPPYEGHSRTSEMPTEPQYMIMTQ